MNKFESVVLKRSLPLSTEGTVGVFVEEEDGNENCWKFETTLPGSDSYYYSEREIEASPDFFYAVEPQPEPVKVGDIIKLGNLGSYSGEPGHVGTITRIYELNGEMWFEMNPTSAGSSWPVSCAELVSLDDINVKIADYNPVYGKDYIAYGCQEYTLDELKAYRKLITAEYPGRITIMETPLTGPMLYKLIKLCEECTT